ncbi:nucleoredoxin [Holotrichia oblita]|uniref:Nucleoredoxin n=1 Tax=Holotrichia oblita TaxID=644536 RepID=A0ACB9SIT4_HOLOL|nr:nucleoredoxin [Holotrichia oblita]
MQMLFYRSQDTDQYIERMPWLCIPWQQADVRTELSDLYNICFVSTLVLLDSNGHVITMDGKAELTADPLAQNFPWKPRSVNILLEKHISNLRPAIVLIVGNEEAELQFGGNVLRPAADNYFKKHNIDFNCPREELFSYQEDHYIQFFVMMESDGALLWDYLEMNGVVPRLIGTDRWVFMEQGAEINVESVRDFVEKFERGSLIF